MIELTESIKLFRDKLQDKSRDELLEIIKSQNPDLIKQINRIEFVFKRKLRHLRWPDGSPIEGRLFTTEELIRIIDPPYIHSTKLEKAGFTDEMQRQLHIASDPVLWSRYFLGAKPRVYQILPMRDLNPKRVLRFGRRMGKTHYMACYILWFCYTNRNVNALIMAPMKSHVGLIYDEIMRLTNEDDALPVVRHSIIRNVESPQYEINFSNGSNVLMFTTGVKSDSKSVGARGQEAHMIIADEMDYMGPDDLNAIYAMLQKTSDRFTRDKIIMGASTPSGLRNTFWDWCTNKELGYNEYWFPAMANPMWDKEMEKEMRLNYPDNNVFRQEVEADWGEPAEGVYPREFVDLAFQHDEYDENGKLKVRRDWKYVADITSANSEFVFGIDWDKYGAGVNLIVLEICNEKYEDPRFAGKTRVAYREEIIKGEFTYTHAIDRIEELNSIFRPKHIYVDRGAGEVQIELLHKRGMESPNTRFQHTVKGVHFSEAVEVRDPFTQQLIKKKAKHFMVDNLYRMFQNQEIFLPGSDEDLYLQIIAYIVKKENVYGEPVFSAGPGTVDHAHDALILACYAVADNYDELLNPKFAAKGFVVSNDAFLPLFNIENARDEKVAEQLEEQGIDAPIAPRRAMTAKMRGEAFTGRNQWGHQWSKNRRRRTFR